MSRAAIVGGGVIGGGWAARFLLNGWDVAVFDPDPAAQIKLGAVLAAARASLPGLYDGAMPAEGRLTICASVEEAVAGAIWVQESVPERLELKQRVLAQVSAAAGPGAVIGSSTSGFKPSDLQDGLEHPGSVLVAHPFVPVYLLPLVEVVPGEGTISDTLTNATAILRRIGMHPLVIGREIDGHVADRLLEAVWREALWLINDGIATTAEVDEAIRLGFGLRWAQMGLFETYRIGGGEAGMAHFLEQFGPALKWPWTKLMDVPDLNDALVARITDQSDAQSGHLSIGALERLRDKNLVAILRALKAQGAGAGAVLAAHDAMLAKPDVAPIPVTVRRQVPGDWTDYNGHMNEARYLELGAQATDALLDRIGAGPEYVAQRHSYFTVETHLRHLGEVHAGELIEVTTQVMAGAGKSLHLFHRVLRGDTLAATAETLLLHVDLTTRKSCLPAKHVAEALAALAQAHSALPVPDGAGRSVGRGGASEVACD